MPHYMVLSMFVHIWFGPTLIMPLAYYGDKQWDRYQCNTDKENVRNMLPLSLKYEVTLTCAMEYGV
jgi:hypothetical protein